MQVKVSGSSSQPSCDGPFAVSNSNYVTWLNRRLLGSSAVFIVRPISEITFKQIYKSYPKMAWEHYELEIYWIQSEIIQHV